MSDKPYNDISWIEFEKTGSITAYLKYKGILPNNGNDDISAYDNKKIGDGEPIGYY